MTRSLLFAAASLCRHRQSRRNLHATTDSLIIFRLLPISALSRPRVSPTPYLYPLPRLHFSPSSDSVRGRSRAVE
ncbi:hypothetical protein LINPERHAP1_LOCUS34520 [Linum perenne]